MAGTNGGGDAADKHQAEVARLREQIAALVQQAKLLLHGEAALRQPVQKPSHAKRAERDRELEVALEKAEWYRKEIKRLRPQLDAMHDPHLAALGAEERDPMELQNLLVEKRKELQRLRKTGEGMDKIAEAQRRAEAAQNALSPELEEKLKRMKVEVEQQKRLNVRLQAERQKVVAARKKAEEEARAAGGELRSKAAELRPRPPGRPSENGSARSGAEGSSETGDARMLKQLRRDMDILQEALRQDDRKFRAAQREDAGEAEYASKQALALRASITEQEAEIAKLRAELAGGAAASAAACIDAADGPCSARSNGVGDREQGAEDVKRSAPSASELDRPPLMPETPASMAAA